MNEWGRRRDYSLFVRSEKEAVVVVASSIDAAVESLVVAQASRRSNTSYDEGGGRGENENI